LHGLRVAQQLQTQGLDLVIAETTLLWWLGLLWASLLTGHVGILFAD
jgi:hypothetical protein